MFYQNRNAVCGQHKEEILRQLRELARLEPDSISENPDTKPINLFQPSAAGQHIHEQDTGLYKVSFFPFSFLIFTLSALPGFPNCAFYM